MKRNLNILIFSWRGPGHPNAGGAEIVTHEYAKAWAKEGHRVTIFTSFYKGARRREKVDGVDIIRSGSQFLGVHWEGFKWYCFEDHQEFDLVIDHFHGVPFFTPLYVRAKKIGFIHEVTKEVWNLNECPFPLNFIVAIVGRTLEPLIFKLYKNIQFMTISNSTKKDLVSWSIPASDITVIHSGIIVPFFKKIPQKELKKTLIYLGALAKDKGIEDALKVFSILNPLENWQFWIVGKSAPAYLNQLKKQTHKLHLEKNTKFWGYVSERKKIELLARAHIVINPSIREGWGLVVIEAASVGTPTVAFNVPGLRDSIVDGKTGILSSEHTVGSLTSGIMELFENKKKYSKISQNAIIWSKNFSWDKAIAASLKLIKKVTG